MESIIVDLNSSGIAGWFQYLFNNQENAPRLKSLLPLLLRNLFVYKKKHWFIFSKWAFRKVQNTSDKNFSLQNSFEYSNLIKSSYMLHELELRVSLMKISTLWLKSDLKSLKANVKTKHRKINVFNIFLYFDWYLYNLTIQILTNCPN